jgi:hypothetical protein
MAGWFHAKWFGLVRKDAPADIDNAFIRRILLAQALYAFGAALCVFSTWWSIGFIVAIQINYVIALRFKPFSWL